MEENNFIPQDIQNILKNIPEVEQLDLSGFICAVMCDMDLSGEYAEEHIILTKEKLFVLRAEYPYDIITFGGYFKDKKVEIKRKKQSFSVDTYDISLLSEPFVTTYVACGDLSCKYDGGFIRLAMFSNRQSRAVHRLQKILAVLCEGKEPSKKDLEESPDKLCPKCGSPYPEQERQICPKCTDKRSIFMRIFSYFKPYRFKIGVLLFCTLASAAAGVVLPYLNGQVLYKQVLGKDPALLGQLPFLKNSYVAALLLLILTIIVLKLSSQLFGTIQGRITAKIVPPVVSDIKCSIFDSMGRLSLKFFLSKQTGTLMTRILEDSNQVTGFFIDALPYIFVNGLTIIFSVAMMFYLNVYLALVTIIILPVMFGILRIWGPLWWSSFSRRHRASRSLNSQINDNLSGSRVIKAFGREDGEKQRFHVYNNRVRESEIDMTRIDTKLHAVFTGVENILMLLSWSVGAILIMRGQADIGMLVSFGGYVALLINPLDFMSYVFRWGAQSMNAAQRIFEIIDTKPDIAEQINPVELPKINGEIKVEGVTFQYEPNKDILKNVSFTAKAGQMLGIVGHSGAGKSTIVNLISRLYDPVEGEIYLDGHNIKELSFDTMHRSIAMVSQETYIFKGTIAENIAYQNPDCPKNDVIEAAKSAAAHDFIMKMPDGYDTLIGANGRQLSGGERQRISIARAILSNPKILILDEATASVDTETELKIQNSIDRLAKGRTTIAIAHRLSTLRNADTLIVVEDGKITEEGTHAELYEKKGTYHKLLTMQNKALLAKGVIE